MKTLNTISEKDVEKVARSLYFIIDKTNVKKVVELYPSYAMEEPNTNFTLIIEQILYDILD